MADRIDIKVTADTREATANLSRFSDKAKEAAESAGRIAAGVAGGIAAIGAATYKIAEFAAAAEQQEMAINRLGPAYEAVRAATAGVVTAQDALKAQQTLVQAGLRVSSEQLATITRAAREYSRATGTELTQSLEQLTDALRTGSGEGLGRFGVSLQQGVTGSRAFGSALEQLTAQQRNAAVSSRTLREDLDKLPEGLMAIGSSILSWLQGPADALTRWVTNLWGVSTNLRGVLSELASAGDTLRQRDRQEATDRANMQRLEAQEGLFRAAGAAGVSVGRESVRGLSPARLARLQQRVAALEGNVQLGAGAAPRGTSRFGVSGLAGQTLGPGFADIDTMRELAGGTASTDAAARRQRRQTSVQQAITELQAEQRAEEEAARRAAQGPAVRRPTGGGGGGTSAVTTALRALHQAQTDAMAREAPRVTVGRPDPGESMEHYLQRLTQHQRDLIAATPTRAQVDQMAREVGQQEEELRKADVARSIAVEEMRREDVDLQQRRIRRDRETRRMARAESLGGRALSALGIETDAEGRIPAFDTLQQGADMLGQSLSTLQSGFANLFNTLAAGSMSAGEAFQQFAAKTLSSLGEMAVNKGVFYTFEGIASLFSNPVAAPTYFAAGAGLIALGVGLGAAGAAVAPSAAPGGSAAPAAARSASGASPRGAGEGAGNVTIVLSSLVPPGPRELQGLVNAQRQAGRYGIDRDRMVPRQVRA